MVVMNVKITVGQARAADDEGKWKKLKRESGSSPKDISPLKFTPGVAGPSPSQYYVFAPPGGARAAYPRDHILLFASSVI
jgi:hypothetical protein